MEEIWKDIEGYEELYQVSNLSRVRSLDKKVESTNQYGTISTRVRKGKILKQNPIKNKERYLEVTLYKDGKAKHKKIHRLVAENFIANTYNLEEVNHIDGDKHNNHIWNLEWVTRSGNQQHAYNTGLNKRRYGKNNARSKIVIQYDKKMNKIEEYKGVREAERKTGCRDSSISACCRGQYKTAGGYIWKYKE